MQELGLVMVILVMGTTLSIFGFIQARPGDENVFLNPTNLVDQIATRMSYYAVMAVGMTVVLAVIDPVLALVAVATAPLTGVLSFVYRRRVRTQSRVRRGPPAIGEHSTAIRTEFAEAANARQVLGRR